MNRNYSLLRTPQTPEDFAKPLLLKSSGKSVDYIGRLRGSVSPIVIQFEDNLSCRCKEDDLGIEPVCWIETKPVYPEDQLYYCKSIVTILQHQSSYVTNVNISHNGQQSIVDQSALTWTKPVPKPVTYTRWLNIYDTTMDSSNVKLRETRALADQYAGDDRIDCIQITFTV